MNEANKYLMLRGWGTTVRLGRQSCHNKKACLIRAMGLRHVFTYRDSLKGLYAVARIFFLLLLNCSAWPGLGLLLVKAY